MQCDNSPPSEQADSVLFTISLTGDFKDSAANVKYRYYPDPEIIAIFPRYGQMNGDTVVDIWGKNFLNFRQYLRCGFGPKEVEAEFIDEGYIRCVSPPSDVVDAPMPLAVTLNSQQFSNPIDYWYYELPSIFMLDPPRGPDTGGTHVLLKGNNFDPFMDMPINNHNDTFCSFGPLGKFPAKVLNSTKVICTSPPSYTLREVDVEITLNFKDYTSDKVKFYYYRPPFLYDIDPLMGPVAGGTDVHIHGSNFQNTGKIFCKFGDNTVPGKFVNVNELLCRSPRADKEGYVPFQIAVHGDDFTSPDLVKYLYYDSPVIYSIEPTCGPERGYTQITVHGDNFIDPGVDMVYCVFNETIFMNTTIYEPNMIKCSSPPVLNAQGVNENKVSFYDIKLTFNNKDLTSSVKRFHYYKEATITSIVPSGGPISGGTIVNITGKNLRPDCACNVTVRFGSYQVAPVINFTDTNIFVKAPSVSISNDVVVSYGINGQQYNPDPGLNYKDLTNTYTYYDAPYITSYTPKEGPSVGGNKMLIKGFGFTPYKDNEGNVIKQPVWLRMKRHDKRGLTEPTEAVYVDNENIHWVVPPGDVGSTHVIELSLNKADYIKVIPGNKSYSYTYLPSPRVNALYPNFVPLKSRNKTTIFVKGKGFKCPKDDCSKVTCRFGEGDEVVYRKGVWVSETEIHCDAPKYTRPDVVVVEVSMDDEIYTNDRKEFGVYEAFIWNVKPNMVSRKGNTTIRIHGYGFVDTGEELKVRYGSRKNKLTCKGKPCIVQGRYIDKNNIEAETLPYDDVVYESSGKHLDDDEFPVELSVYGDDYTNNNVTIFYFAEPIYGDPIPNQVPANGDEPLFMVTDYRTKRSDPNNPLNEEEIFPKYGNATCRFKSSANEEKMVYTKAKMTHYPLDDADYYNAIMCPSPEWEMGKNQKEEQVILDISVNNADYSGNKLMKITERLDIYRIYPPCGPTVGNTKMRLVGTGLRQFKNLHLKWGVLNSIPVDEKTRESFIYQEGKAISSDPYENEVLSLNEETKLLYDNKSEYQTVYSYSPKLKNYDRTHGGPVYLSLGRTNELELNKEIQTRINKTTYSYYYYPSSSLEYYYYQQPIMKDMKPSGGVTTGGTPLIIRGAWFKYMPEYGVKPYVKIGDKVSHCTFESTVRILCRSPPNEETSVRLPVKVGLNGIDFGDSEMTYYYYKPALIHKIIPASGPGTGGTRVHLIGEHFTNLSSAAEFKCRFTAVDHKVSPKHVPAVYENSTSILCITPGGWSSGATANIEVTFNGEDYSDSESKFYFYSIASAYPRSAPADVENGVLTIEGSGFKENEPVICSFDKINYKATEVKWDYIKCPIPRAIKGADFFGSIPLAVNINGFDYYEFPDGFHYYPQIEVHDFYPKTGPAKGRGVIKIYGNKFRADFSTADPGCRFGPHIGDAEVINSQEMLCHIPQIEAINQTYKVEASLNKQSFVKASTKDELVPYGIYDIEPYSGPVGSSTQITVTGEGFPKNGKGKCRFGVAGNYIVLNGKVLSNQKMICSSPKKYEGIPKVTKLPLAIPFSVSFVDENINLNKGVKKASRLLGANDYTFDPWTNTEHVFRFYEQPIIERITPKSCKVKEIIDVYVYAKPETPFIERILYLYQ